MWAPMTRELKCFGERVTLLRSSKPHMSYLTSGETSCFTPSGYCSLPIVVHPPGSVAMPGTQGHVLCTHETSF